MRCTKAALWRRAKMTDLPLLEILSERAQVEQSHRSFLFKDAQDSLSCSPAPVDEWGGGASKA